MIGRLSVYVFVCLLFVFKGVYAETLEGMVSKVVDGDTVHLSNSHGVVTIRLANIDAPEMDQEAGLEAQKFLENLIMGDYVVVDVSTKDRYGRSIGLIYKDDENINTTMVKMGYAWVYDQYNEDLELYKYQESAKSEKSGLWKNTTAIPPWEWRKGAKTKIEEGSFSCSVRKTCKMMVSCEEAFFYLTQCGVNRLDGDRDGVPCEQICSR